MADMTVSLVLRLRNLLGKGVAAARKDLKGLKNDTTKLQGSRGAERLAKDLRKVQTNAKAAERGVDGLRRDAERLRRVRGGEQLARDMKDVERNADKARRAMSRLRHDAQRREVLAMRRGGGAPSLALPVNPHGGAKKHAAKPGKHAAAEPAAQGPGLIAAGRGLLPALGGYYATRMAIKGTVGEAIAWDKAMAEVKKKVDGLDDPKALAALENQIKTMARAYGTPMTEMAGLVAEAGAAGIAYKDLGAFMDVAVKASVGWDMSAREASNQLAMIRAGMQMTIPQIAELSDKINKAGDITSAAEKDIVEMFQRSGAAAQAFGVDADTSLAVLTGARSMGVQTETASRWYTAFVTKLGNASRVKKARKALGELGLNAVTVEKGLKTKPYETIVDVLQKIGASAKGGKIALDIFGQEWVDETLRVAKGLPEIEKVKRMLEAGGYKGSLAENLKIQMATTAKHLDRLKVLATDIGTRLGNWALPPINSQIEQLLKLFDELDRRTQRQDAAKDLAGRLNRGESMTAADRQRLVDDPEFAAAVDKAGAGQRHGKAAAEKIAAEKQAKKDMQAISQEPDRAKQDAIGFASNRRLLGAQIAELETRLKKQDPSGQDSMLGDQRDRLKRLKGQLAGLPAEQSSGRIVGRPDLAVDPKQATELDRQVKDWWAKYQRLQKIKKDFPEAAGEADAKLREFTDPLARQFYENKRSQNDKQSMSPAAGAVLGKNPEAGMALLKENAAQARAAVEQLTGALGDLQREVAAAKAAKAKEVFDPAEGKAIPLADAVKKIDAMKAKLLELQPAADEAAGAIRQKLAMDLGAEGKKMMGSLAAGITAGSATAEAAALSSAAKIRAAFASATSGMVPAIRSAEAGMPAVARPSRAGGSSAGATGGRVASVTIGDIHVHGSADPERTARKVAATMRAEMRDAVGGSLHDGATA